MEKVREFAKNTLYLLIIAFCFIVLIIILISVIINIKYFFNIGFIINSIVNQISNEKSIGVLSLNIGVLQAFIAVIGVGIVIAAYFNFTTIRDKLKEVDKILDEHKQSIDETKKQINYLINIKPNNSKEQSDIELDIKKGEEETKKLINKKEKGEMTDDSFRKF